MMTHADGAFIERPRLKGSSDVGRRFAFLCTGNTYGLRDEHAFWDGQLHGRFATARYCYRC
jgi:hypothetical protein